MKQKNVKVKVFKEENLKTLSKKASDLGDNQVAYFIEGDAKVGEIKETSSYFAENRTILILTVLGLIGLFLALFFNTRTEPNSKIYMLIGVIIAIWGFFLASALVIKDHQSKTKENLPPSTRRGKEFSLMEGMETDDKMMVGLVSIGLILVFILGILNYVLGTKIEGGYVGYFADRTITFAIVGICEFVVVAMVLYRLDHLKRNPSKYHYLTLEEFEELEELKKTEEITERESILDNKKFVKSFFISQHILLMALIFFGIPTIMGINIFDNLNLPYLDSMQIQYSLALLSITASGIIGIFQMRKSQNANDGDLDKTAMIRYLIMIMLPLIASMTYPTSNLIMEAKVLEGGIFASAQLGDFNYFNGVYVAIVSSRYTQFSMVIIVISALSIIIGKARGQSGTATMVIGALGMAGVPMIITVMAFIGQVPAPIEFTSLFGEGFANLIFAISYTSVISLALALVGLFYEIVPSATSGNLD